MSSNGTKPKGKKSGSSKGTEEKKQNQIIIENAAKTAIAVEQAKKRSSFLAVNGSYTPQMGSSDRTGSTSAVPGGAMLLGLPPRGGSLVDAGATSDTDGYEYDHRHEEMSLFQALKPNASVEKLKFKHLKKALKSAGLMLNEHKLKVYKDDTELTLDQFCKYIAPARRKVIDALTGTLIIPDFKSFTSSLTAIFNSLQTHTDGKRASYIPELASVNPKLWSVGFRSIDNQVFNVGDHEFLFAVQSTTKVISYLLALKEHGEEYVHRFVGREPSGRSFNGLALNEDNVPHNPFINAGAMVCASLIKTENVVEYRQEHIIDCWKQLIPPGAEIRFNETMYRSEKNHADRNYCLGFMMQENGTFSHGRRKDLPPRKWRQNSLQETFDLYFRTCSLELSTNSMACVSATLANGGVNPITNKRVFDQEHVKLAVALMYSCGMYDYSGEWNIRVGLPSKSGVAGCLMIPIPGLGGLTTFSPKLDRIGNSARGIAFVEKMCETFSFHHLDKMLGSVGKIDPTFKKTSNTGEGLIHAAHDADKQAVRQLLASRINVNYSDYDGRTPLMLAASEGHKDMVSFLLGHGADPEHKDRWGNTAYDDATREGHKSVGSLIKKYIKTQGKDSIFLVSPAVGARSVSKPKAAGTVSK